MSSLKSISNVFFLHGIFLFFALYHGFAYSVETDQFKAEVKRLEVLKDSNLTSAIEQLLKFQPLLNELSIKDKLVYFQLLSEMYVDQSQYTEGKRIANQGLQLAKQLASPSIKITQLLYTRGFAVESLGDIASATEDYKKGLEVAESLHNKAYIAYGLINLGAVYYLTDDYQRSLVILNDAFNIAAQTSDEELKGSVTSELGILYSYLKQDEQSTRYYLDSYNHFKKAGKLLFAHNSLHNIAIHHHANGRYQQAIRVFQTIIDESKTVHDNQLMYGVYSGMAWAHVDKEDSNPDVGYEYLLKAQKYLDFTEQHGAVLQFYMNQAFILFELKRYDETLASIAKAEEIFLSEENLTTIQSKNYVSLLNLRANTFFEQKTFKKAYELKSSVMLQIEAEDEKEDTLSIEKVRLNLESEQADLRNKMLQSQKSLNEAALSEVKLANEEQNIYLMVSALVALAFAWLLVKLLQSQKKLKVATSIDPLTGTANRRSLMHKGNKVFSLALNKKIAFSVLMIDIDKFKRINDQLGHSVGDQVLIQIAELGLTMMRKTDIFGRFGGEEFIVFLPKTSLHQAIDIANRLRRSIDEKVWQIVGLDLVTISVGVAAMQEGTSTDLASLIKKADEQLYCAKAQGRNRVCG
ncbi:tetratricopeptide repeat-containing diguanylate cyclase [Litorilituus lipolyticus]|uniref:diguanylate cyclase n=1 Tax=Litorilituus lipolyticus TaxID=2491017 RepID=A0A502L3W1_9GAMM|nr:tetratricopeptide repeat-containing diguanylate cyclase [Litorilituus lipolyticus]TPH18562.1 diguanylate cyclase [Litorilituus lipolyticus]